MGTFPFGLWMECNRKCLSLTRYKRKSSIFSYEIRGSIVYPSYFQLGIRRIRFSEASIPSSSAATKCSLPKMQCVDIDLCLVVFAEAAVVGRGCSTKDKVFYKECETHNYGDSLEKMCFCSFHLCNTSNQLNCPSFWTLTLLVFLLATLTQSCWDPWPSLSFRTLIISDATTTTSTTHITKLNRPADQKPDHQLTLAINSSDTISVRKKSQNQKHDKDFVTISRKLTSDNMESESVSEKECHHLHYQFYCSSVAYKRR